MESFQGKAGKLPIFSPELTFSSKTTENNSTCAQSFMIEGLPATHILARSGKSHQTPSVSDSEKLQFRFSNNSSGQFQKQKEESGVQWEDQGARHR